MRLRQATPQPENLDMKLVPELQFRQEMHQLTGFTMRGGLAQLVQNEELGLHRVEGLAVHLSMLPSIFEAGDREKGGGRG